MLLERLEEAGLVDINLSGTAKHSRLKGLLNPISIAGGCRQPISASRIQKKTKQRYPFNTGRKLHCKYLDNDRQCMTVQVF